MKQFTYEITDPNGIHARPAGKIVAVAKNYSCHTHLWVDSKEYNLKQLLSIMGANASKGQDIVVRCEGEDENNAYEALKKAFEDNL